MNSRFSKITEAFIIAYLGGLSIEVRYFNDFKGAHKEYNYLKKYYECVKFCKGGDLIVELEDPHYQDSLEPIQVTFDRIAKASDNILPPLEISEVSKMLINSVSKRLTYDENDRNTILKIAQVMAKIQGADSIGTDHVALATMYRSKYDSDCIIIAEDNVIEFGPNIQIQRLPSEAKHIKAAIQHLTDQLNTLTEKC